MHRHPLCKSVVARWDLVRTKKPPVFVPPPPICTTFVPQNPLAHFFTNPPSRLAPILTKTPPAPFVTNPSP